MADPPNISSVSTVPIPMPEAAQKIVSVTANSLQQPSAVQTYSFMSAAGPSTIVTSTSQPVIIATSTNPVRFVTAGGTTTGNVVYPMQTVTFISRNNINFVNPTSIRQYTPRISSQPARIPPQPVRNAVPVVRISTPAKPSVIPTPVKPNVVPTPVRPTVKVVQPNPVPTPPSGIRVIQPAKFNGPAMQPVPRPVARPSILARPPVSKPPIVRPPLPRPTFMKPSAASLVKSIIPKPVGAKKPFMAVTKNKKVPTKITPILKGVNPVKPLLPSGGQINGINKTKKFIDTRPCFPLDINRPARAVPFDWLRYRKGYAAMVAEHRKDYPHETPRVKKPWDKAYQPPMPPPRRRSSPQKQQPKPSAPPVKAFHLTAHLPMSATIGPLTESNGISSPKKRKAQPTGSPTVIKRPKPETFDPTALPTPTGKSASTESVRSSGSDSGVETASQVSAHSSSGGTEVLETVITDKARILTEEEPCSSTASTSYNVPPTIEELKASLHSLKSVRPEKPRLVPQPRKRPAKTEVKQEISEFTMDPVPTASPKRGRNYFKRNGVYKARSKPAEWKTTVSDLHFDNEDLVYLHIVFNKFYDEGLLPFMDEPYKQFAKAANLPDAEKLSVPTKAPKAGAAQFFRNRIQMNTSPEAYVDEKTRIPEAYIDKDLADLTPNKSGCARCEPFRRRDKNPPPDVTSVTDDGRRFIEVTKEDEDNIRQAKESKKNDRRMTRHILTQIQNEAPELAKLQIFKSNSLANEKLLKYAKSPIHGYGLFALCAIEPEQIIIEYVGEQVRHEVADFREKRYESQGMNSSYMFRLDDEYVIDATKMGNLARFINHCCNPNCYARTSSRNNKKHILIYSKRYIDKGEELTYDYKFPLEDCKIPCHCGAKTCRKFLN